VGVNAKSGDKVKVHYTGTLEDGTPFDSSRDGDPVEFTLGTGEVIAGFEKAVDGMAVGDSKTVSVPPEDGYGPRDEGQVVVIDRTELPAELEPEVGMILEASSDDGVIAHVLITAVAGDKVTLDANHELAGKTLSYEITLVEIVGN
jgi:peptidylprolyl isomerase